jgi:hypothetical protein
MAPWLQLILFVLAIVIVSVFLFYAVKRYILSKYVIKRGYPLALMILLLFVPTILSLVLPQFVSVYRSLLFQIVQMVATSVSFLTYLEILKIDKERKNRPVVGRPKAKAGRVKNN